MKLWELMAELVKYPAGCDVSLSPSCGGDIVEIAEIDGKQAKNKLCPYVLLVGDGESE